MAGLSIVNSWSQLRLLQRGGTRSFSRSYSYILPKQHVLFGTFSEKRSSCKCQSYPDTSLSLSSLSCYLPNVYCSSSRSIMTSALFSAPMVRRRTKEAIQEFQKLLEGNDEGTSVEDQVKNYGSENIITIPVHLEKRLFRRQERESTKRAIRQKIIDNSRMGRKSRVIIHCKHLNLNHYHGQSYERNRDIPLASKGWCSRKSKGDFFTLFPGSQNQASFFTDDTKSMTFVDLGIGQEICNNLTPFGINQPTHIQAFGIPQILKGTNTLVAAETGCGKTLAYLLPLIQHILEGKKARVRDRSKPGHPEVVILAPSRELADQIYEVALQLTFNLDVSVKLLQGGSLGGKIKNVPKSPIDILVATVNAVKVLSGVGAYNLGRVSHIVLDEADTLLDDSFFPDLVAPFLSRFQWDEVKSDVQLTLVSATMPSELQETIGQIVNIDSFFNCTTPGLHSLSPHVPQTFIRLPKSQKAAKIIEILKEDDENKVPVMVFCNKSDTCTWLSHHLNDEGFEVACIHGRMPLSYRAGRMDAYKRGEINVIIVTDLASRGIDTVRTRHVINYEFPLFLADYIHRCGRTGRVGSEGSCRVTNFISRPGEVKTVNGIEKSVRQQKTATVNANIKKQFSEHYGSYKEILPINEEEAKPKNRNKRKKVKTNEDIEETEP